MPVNLKFTHAKSPLKSLSLEIWLDGKGTPERRLMSQSKGQRGGNSWNRSTLKTSCKSWYLRGTLEKSIGSGVRAPFLTLDDVVMTESKQLAWQKCLQVTCLTSNQSQGTDWLAIGNPTQQEWEGTGWLHCIFFPVNSQNSVTADTGNVMHCKILHIQRWNHGFKR